MKPIYRCDYCGHQDIAEKIEEHEKTCLRNYNLRGCPTCLHKKGPCLTSYECKKGVEIPEKSYILHCSQWEREESPYDPDSPFAQVVRSMFGGF